LAGVNREDLAVEGMVERDVPVLSSDGSEEVWRLSFAMDPPWTVALKGPRTGEERRATGEDLYESLTQICRDLEKVGKLLCINASRVDARPSPMLRQATGGGAVYLLSSRRPARRVFPTRVRHKAVDAFEPAPRNKVASIDEQERY